MFIRGGFTLAPNKILHLGQQATDCIPISHGGAKGSQPLREFVIRFLLALRESTAMEGSKALSLSLSMLPPSDSAQL